MAQPVVVDFETEAIQPRPHYPPKPVGVAIKYPGKPPKYLHWGHPDDSKAGVPTGAQMAELRDIWRRPLLFHHSKFDLDVAETHLKLKIPRWDYVDDTLFPLFLKDPHAPSLSLGPSAERYLGMKKKEDDDRVREWLVEHKVIAHNENPGPYISQVPWRIAAGRACGDVTRTAGLHELLQPKLDRRMRVAYDRERQLVPILLTNERGGMRVDLKRIQADLKVYHKAFIRVEQILREKLRDKHLNLDDDKAVGDALYKTKIVREWTMTKGGKNRPPQRSVSKANLTLPKFRDKKVGLLLMYRNKLQVVIKNNMEPWLAQGLESGGWVYTEWSQVRHHERGKDARGARSGRITCPRWLNITKSYIEREDLYEHPAGFGLPQLPLPRKYLLPDPGEEWNHLDFDQQEFKIVAHYEDGDLKKSYLRNPKLDYHANVQTMVKAATNRIYDRRTIKAVNFGILYGEGVDLLARELMMERDDADELKANVKRVTPGVVLLDYELKRRGREGVPIRTWGGRLYYCEPPGFSKKHNREMTFEYKLLNYLAQGSAADVTKEAIIRYHQIRKDGRMLVTVYDEINFSAEKKAGKMERKRLREAMESIELDVAMTVTSDIGPNWGELEELKGEATYGVDGKRS